MSFSTFRELIESVKQNQFNIIVDGKEYLIKRHFHVRDSRENSSLPRDYAMTKSKYAKVFSLSMNKIDKNKPYTITWSSNGKSNAISVEFINDTTISIFSAIMKSDKPESKLFAKYIDRISLGILND